MINLSIEPNNTQFSIKNAYALALASRLAYKSEETIRHPSFLDLHFVPLQI